MNKKFLLITTFTALFITTCAIGQTNIQSSDVNINANELSKTWLTEARFKANILSKACQVEIVGNSNNNAIDLGIVTNANLGNPSNKGAMVPVYMKFSNCPQDKRYHLKPLLDWYDDNFQVIDHNGVIKPKYSNNENVNGSRDNSAASIIAKKNNHGDVVAWVSLFHPDVYTSGPKNPIWEGNWIYNKDINNASSNLPGGYIETPTLHTDSNSVTLQLCYAQLYVKHGAQPGPVDVTANFVLEIK